jgi:hypothetical protein
MNDIVRFVGSLLLGLAVGFGGYYVLDAIFPVEEPAVEEADTDNLTAGRYHQRTRTNDFFRKGRG